MLLWLTLECFSRQKIAWKQINWTCTTGSFSQETVEMGMVTPKWVWLLNFRAHTNRAPLQEILDPPLGQVALCYHNECMSSEEIGQDDEICSVEEWLYRRRTPSPPLFQANTPTLALCLMPSQNISELVDFTSLLSQTHAGFFAALLEINYFCQLVPTCFFIFAIS